MTSELKRRRLIAVELKNGEELISIHRKLQARILRDLANDPSLGQAVFNQAFALVRSRFPHASPIQVPEPEKWQTCKKYLPHVLSLQRLSVGNTIHLKFTAGLARLFSDGGIDLWERGLTTEGLSLLKSAEATLDQIDPEDFQQLRANIHVIISLLLQDSGLVNIGECHDRIRTALGIRKQHNEDCDAESYSRDDEILLYNAWSDYACVLLQLNMFDEAEPIFERCLLQYHKWGDSDAIPYEYAKGYHHTAFCLMYRGLEDQAVESAQICLINVEKATGKSAAYYRWKFDLACIMLQHSSFLQSVSWQSDTINMHKEVLEARLQLHGRFAFLTLESYYALGSALSYLGNLTEAETCMRTIIEAEKARPGSCNEVALARTHFYLSLLLLLLEEGSQASQHPTSRSEADTAIVSTSTAPERAQDRKGSLLAIPSSTVENPNPALRPSSPAQSSVVAVGTQDQQPTAPKPETRLSLEPILRESTANLRRTEAADLAQAAKKVLDKHRSQLSSAFAHLHTDLHSADAQRFVEENPIVLYDLMQPVFDGRFAGRDVMEYLRLVKL
jgi:tetratricopeptide (TPR) repeat protein